MKLPLTIGAKVASAIYDADGVPVCIIDSMQEASREDERQMARRIVACVNACEGISTENLTDNVPLKQGLSGLNKRIRDAEAQRDELLAALEAFREDVSDNRHAELASVDPYSIGQEVLDKIDAAIARAKGGAA